MCKLNSVLLLVFAVTLVAAKPRIFRGKTCNEESDNFEFTYELDTGEVLSTTTKKPILDLFANLKNILYKHTYELDNGQIFSEAGALKDDGVTQYKTGAYSFVGPDGQTYWVTYTADENGFQPIIGAGPGGISPGQDSSIDPNALKSLVG